MAVLKAGTRLRSNVCTTEAMVVAAPAGDVELTCGGAPMIAIAETSEGGVPADGAAEGTQLGKRYVNEAADLEVLCTKPGDGSLGVDGTLLVIKEAKPLPSSD